jgi:hypothetical protein
LVLAKKNASVFFAQFDNNVEKVQTSKGLISILEIPSKKENEKG